MENCSLIRVQLELKCGTEYSSVIFTTSRKLFLHDSVSIIRRMVTHYQLNKTEHAIQSYASSQRLDFKRMIIIAKKYLAML